MREPRPPQGPARRLRIAVIGGGAAGVSAAHLLQRAHDVTMFERNSYVGGHTNTVVLGDGPDAGTPVDTGFIVLNNKTYPTMHRFLKSLGVPWRWSDMSFAFWDERTGFRYAGTDWNGLFAQRSNLASPRFWRFLAEIRRFCRLAGEALDGGRLDGITLGEFVRRERFDGFFVRGYLLPMGAAIWSTSARGMLRFPARTLVAFFRNHGLLSMENRPRWQTVVGGSQSYVKAFLRSFKGEVFTASPVEALERREDAVRVRLASGELRLFDHAVVATHADEALRLLADPSEEERRLLGAWSYNRNHTLLHFDTRVLPPEPRAWASWNYVRESGGDADGNLSVTYDMNRLQGLATRRRYLVTLNRAGVIDPKRVVREFQYTHPLYTEASIATQEPLRRLNGERRTHFAGSYFGYGFHEDAIKSGVAVAKAFGQEL
ncbi:MAG: FAD-dependent oxidoreductase [Candidatus Sumerlaeia bacterium]|nr:FAD-dependent oxidoreductase [Candidatus Sumerlaeia bacterium]